MLLAALICSPARAEAWAPKPLAPELARLPLAERIAQAPVFVTQLAYVGQAAPPAAESQTLWAAIEVMRVEGPRAGLAAMEAFLAAHPDSALGALAAQPFGGVVRGSWPLRSCAAALDRRVGTAQGRYGRRRRGGGG